MRSPAGRLAATAGVSAHKYRLLSSLRYNISLPDSDAEIWAKPREHITKKFHQFLGVSKEGAGHLGERSDEVGEVLDLHRIQAITLRQGDVTESVASSCWLSAYKRIIPHEAAGSLPSLVCLLPRTGWCSRDIWSAILV